MTQKDIIRKIKIHLPIIIWAMCTLALLFVWGAAALLLGVITYPMAEYLENKFNDKND